MLQDFLNVNDHNRLICVRLEMKMVKRINPKVYKCNNTLVFVVLENRSYLVSPTHYLNESKLYHAYTNDG